MHQLAKWRPCSGSSSQTPRYVRTHAAIDEYVWSTDGYEDACLACLVRTCFRSTQSSGCWVNCAHAMMNPDDTPAILQVMRFLSARLLAWGSLCALFPDGLPPIKVGRLLTAYQHARWIKSTPGVPGAHARGRDRHAAPVRAADRRIRTLSFGLHARTPAEPRDSWHDTEAGRQKSRLELSASHVWKNTGIAQAVGSATKQCCVITV